MVRNIFINKLKKLINIKFPPYNYQKYNGNNKPIRI